jgi:hypothetical protein
MGLGQSITEYKEVRDRQNKVVVEGHQLSPQQKRICLLQQADGSPAYKS